MDKETVIALAKKTDLWQILETYSGEFGDGFVEADCLPELMAFVALIRDHLTYSSVHSCHPKCTKPACVAMRKAVEAEREECAKVVEAEQARVLGKQEGESWEPVNINIRMTAVLLPDIAAAIRSRT